MKKINIKIDGYEIEANEGENLLDAALEAGIYIPHLCYHPDLTPLGNCKLCSVEIQGKSDIVQSCETIVQEGMVVNTKTEKVKKLTMMALELILASHPKDCTSCDKYLNCELQALMQYMGVVHSRFREIEKDNTRIAASDKMIKREMNRCIQCGRCVRACDHLRGVNALSINKKNGETYVYTKDDQWITNTDCRFCGACVEVCPTGALQDVKGVFDDNAPRRMALIPCKNHCPAHTDIPMYIRLVEEGRYSDAVSVLREKLTFPHSLGYICSHPCEAECKRNHVNEPISIREIKRFAVENDKEETWRKKVKISEAKKKSIAIIGTGPSGITAAYYLAKEGYNTVVYDKQPTPGGMLSYGIPKYRLPQSIVDKEINILKEAGIEVKISSKVKSLEDLKDKGYDAILIAVGANKGKRPPAYSKKWSNSLDAVDFCRRSNEGTLPKLGDTVIVYGGGNVGFDCGRTAKKLGVNTVKIICMEARDKMLADKEEIVQAIEENIEILDSKVILSIQEADEAVKAVTVIDIESFKFTEKGMEIEEKEGSESDLAVDTIIFATGQQPDLDGIFGVDLVKGTFVKVDKNMQTSVEGVFAAGDVIYGTKSVVEAIASGREAAINIDKYLGGTGHIDETLFEREKLNSEIGTIENFASLERRKCLKESCDAKAEADRCLQCDLRLEIQKVKYWVDPHFKTVKEVKR